MCACECVLQLVDYGKTAVRDAEEICPCLSVLAYGTYGLSFLMDLNTDAALLNSQVAVKRYDLLPEHAKQAFPARKVRAYTSMCISMAIAA